MALDPGWDFFVSYTQADHAWAEWIAWTLEEDGHHVLMQAWDLVPGGNWVKSMQDGVSKASRTIAVMSEAYLGSVYGAAEWQAAWSQDPAGTERKLLTIRVNDCDRPGLLTGVTGIDVFGLDESQAKARLRSAVSAVLTGRAKPEVAPRFPGANRVMPRAKRFPGGLPTAWKVPARNPSFVGRADDLRRLEATVAAGYWVTVHSIHGMGGIGKTQLANEYAHVNAGLYDLVWWIDAEESATIPDQFAKLADQLGLDPAGDPETLQAQVHGALRHVPGWLLIFDNADRVDTVQPWLPAVPIAPGTPGHVIVTTRRGGFSSLGQVFDVDVLDTDAAIRLMSARVPDLDPALAESIAVTLGCLPLALEQASAFLDRSQMPAEDYLALLNTRTPAMLNRGRADSGKDTVATVWALSFERLGAETPSSLQLLDVCAYLAPEAIPLDLITAHADLLPAPLADAASDQLAFGEAIAALVDYSLVRRTGSGLQVHRLVQAALRVRHGAGVALATRAGGPDVNLHLHAGPNEQLLTALAVLHADAPAQIVGAPQGWPRWEVLLPHVLAVTGHVDDSELPMDPAGSNIAWLLDRAATYLRVHGSVREAEPLAQRALDIAEALHGPDHPTVASRLSNLALILRDLGDPASAKPLAQRALDIAETIHGPDHPTVGIRLSILALILQDLGDPAGAKPLAQRALDIAETTHGPEHPTVAIRLSNLAWILRDLGELAEARPLAQQALDIAETTHGPDHPTVAIRLNNLALILQDLGDPGGARPLTERALEIDQATYGPDHPTVAIRLNTLAMVLRDLGEPAGARPLAQRALDIDQATYGPDHPEVATSLRNLALILRDIGDLPAAIPLAQRALDIAESAYGPDHPRTGLIRAALGTVVADDELGGD